MRIRSVTGPWRASLQRQQVFGAMTRFSRSVYPEPGPGQTLKARGGMAAVSRDVNGHSKFPHSRSSKTPPPLVENTDELSACGGCGQAVCGLSKALWSRLRAHIAGSVHRLPSLTLPLSSA